MTPPLKPAKVCHLCRADLLDGSYAGEVWEANEDAPYATLPVLDSWWLGEFNPCCVECAIGRDEKIWEATATAFHGLAALAEGLNRAYQQAMKEEPE